MTDTLHILRNEADYRAALGAYEACFDKEPVPGTPEADRFELLGLLLARYEEERFPMPTSDPVEAIRFAMDRQGLQQSDLAELLGSRSRASEILNGRRELSLSQIRLLAKEWRIPAEALLGDMQPA
ncbi:helix-turn-helix domain-containing protein [Brevundimonas sp.]|uniref:helix-turn-helix domain-containing protein n=1 Tax=Brevundimonas sp. TaxID=1871086 RepID=UPI001D82394A|nr:helix-turn-helix domain-containing protein [Brevundimonas sp.]MBL0948325.1 helix-turn-helix domain-containing protein [Brevundimonas sp.]